ncbi:MAG: hydrolase [Sphingomonadaceae bacterium]|uniref:hydrolase n=1 Tax=Thermaurantiacus sp. TaxID=2820283 RepID=UPI00298F334D|nr:hydrolase [Thermaurantiacus sp.]MCS6987202.1 hydrolase [Sphingomonadaceae bacterium]MDW8415764.1 hydrolase [Thermaurantiacus sp.]
MNLSADERAALGRVDPEAMLARVTAWAKVASGSRDLEGLERMAALLTEAASPLGEVHRAPPALATRVEPDGEVTAERLGDSLLLSARPDAPTRVILTGHYDTVFGPGHPFRDVRWLRPGVLNGPGVADMKGGIVVLLEALRLFEASPFAPNLGWEVVLNADEEVGSPGSAPLLARCAARVQAGLVFEPSLPDGTLVGARPGSGNFALIVRGRSAHAGRNPEEGRNAVLAAADLALRLSTLAGPDLKVNVAAIEGGGVLNMVPGTAVLRVNLRPASTAAEDRASAGLDEAMAQVARRHDVTIARHGGFARPPKPLDARQRPLFALVARTAADLGLEIGWRPTGGVCDGNNLAACGLPVVDTLGVRGGAIHSPDEFLIVESLAERARLAALVLMRLAQHGVPAEGAS